MFFGVSTENIKKNKLCALCAFAVKLPLESRGDVGALIVASILNKTRREREHG
jgi:hypothetical protein